MFKRFLSSLVIAAALTTASYAQNQASATSASPVARPTEHLLGAVTAIDPSFKSLSIKEDKTGAEYTISLETTKTFLKVPPEAKDLKAAVRFNPSDLKVGDRVAVRGYKMDGVSNGVTAASVLLMSARDLQQVHRSEMEAWKHSRPGVVTSVDTATKQLKVTMRTPNGLKVIAVDGTNAQFTRYSPTSPQAPAASQLSEIQPGDQVRVIGKPDANGSIMTAEKIYFGTFRTVAGTVKSVSSDGKQITVSDRRTKEPVEFHITPNSNIRKLSPQEATTLAQRPSGDLAQLLESAPVIDASSLKPGDAVIASGGTGANHEELTATNIVAGVEPLLQAPARGTNHSSSTGNDWNLDLAIPVE